jgi:hypothetical protein
MSARTGHRSISEVPTPELDTVVEKIMTRRCTSRNAMDHGIESPEVRFGCRQAGWYRLSLNNVTDPQHRHRDADDGAGLDRERILQKSPSGPTRAYCDPPD